MNDKRVTPSYMQRLMHPANLLIGLCLIAVVTSTWVIFGFTPLIAVVLLYPPIIVAVLLGPFILPKELGWDGLWRGLTVLGTIVGGLVVVAIVVAVAR